MLAAAIFVGDHTTASRSLAGAAAVVQLVEPESSILMFVIFLKVIRYEYDRLITP